MKLQLTLQNINRFFFKVFTHLITLKVEPSWDDIRKDWKLNLVCDLREKHWTFCSDHWKIYRYRVEVWITWVVERSICLGIFSEKYICDDFYDLAKIKPNKVKISTIFIPKLWFNKNSTNILTWKKIEFVIKSVPLK